MQPVRSLSRRMTRAGTMMIDPTNEDDSVVDSELVPSSLASIAPVLRVANDIEKDNPRVAYLCMISQLLSFFFGVYCLSLFGFENIILGAQPVWSYLTPMAFCASVLVSSTEVVHLICDASS